jgi:outer membrane protein TolC
MLSYSFAPLSIGASGERFGQVIQVEQWFRLGRTKAERRVSGARVQESEHELQSVRNRLVLRSAILFSDYYAVERALETNHHHQEVIEDLLAVAQAQYAAGSGSQQDPLQAELALAELEVTARELQSQRELVVAEMNGLLHRSPGEPLPPPPVELRPEADAQPQEKLYAQALEDRPDLRARSAAVERQRAQVEVARRRFAPDMSVMVQYNSMWPSYRHQIMTGIGLRLPLQVGSIKSAVREARSEVAAAKADLTASQDEVLVEVERARAQVRAAADIVDLYRRRLLPTAEQQLEAAKIAYTTGRSDFQAVLEAERSLREVGFGFDRAVADVEQRGAALRYAIGDMRDCKGKGGSRS